jgi:hypothetical protein
VTPFDGLGFRRYKSEAHHPNPDLDERFVAFCGCRYIRRGKAESKAGEAGKGDGDGIAGFR